MADKVRFKDLPDYACFRPKVKSNPGKKMADNVVRWHGNSSNDLVLSGKARKGLLTTESLVIPVRCPGERLKQSPKTLRQCLRLRDLYRSMETLIDEARSEGDRDEARRLADRQADYMMAAMDLDCGWPEVD